MRKSQLDRDIVTVLVATLITVVCWVGFEVYRAYNHRQVPEVVQKYLQEFDPKLDTTVLDKLEKRLP